MSSTAKKDNREDMWLSALDIAMPLYARALFSELETCVADVDGGRDLSKTSPGRSAPWVEYAAETARKAGAVADQALMSTLDELVAMPFDGLDDFSLAVLAQVLFERNPGMEDPEVSDRMNQRNWAAMAQILNSAEGHPLLDYQWLASDFVEYSEGDQERDEIEILKRCLANALGSDDDEARVMPLLRHIAELQIESGEIEEGCRVYGELIASDPLDFENYYSASLELHNKKHYDLALKTAKRAHQMLRITKTDHDMAGHLSVCVDGDRSVLGTEGAVVDIAAEKPLKKALETGFMRGAHLPISELVKRVVPDIFEIPVKVFPTL